MEKNLTLQLSHATEIAAIAAARAAGFGNKEKADDAAVKAMRKFFNQIEVETKKWGYAFWRIATGSNQWC